MWVYRSYKSHRGFFQTSGRCKTHVASHPAPLRRCPGAATSHAYSRPDGALPDYPLDGKSTGKSKIYRKPGLFHHWNSLNISWTSTGTSWTSTGNQGFSIRSINHILVNLCLPEILGWWEMILTYDWVLWFNWTLNATCEAEGGNLRSQRWKFVDK